MIAIFYKVTVVRPSVRRRPSHHPFLGGLGRSFPVSAQMADETNLRLESSAAVGAGDGGRSPW